VSTEEGARVVYHPLLTRSPALLNLAGRLAAVTKVADDGSGRAMLLFGDLSLVAAVPDEFTPAGDR
jgi:hypothetical protein